MGITIGSMLREFLVTMHKNSKMWVFISLVWIAKVYDESIIVTSTKSMKENSSLQFLDLQHLFWDMDRFKIKSILVLISKTPYLSQGF